MARVKATCVAGDVIAVPLPNGRCGAICIVDVDKDSGSIQFLVLDGFWDATPPKSVVARLKPMGHPYGERALLPGQANVWKGWFQGAVPRDFAIVGRTRLTTALRRHGSAQGTMVFQNAEHFRRQLHDHWRSIHDREALDAERAAAHVRYEAEHARKAAARKATNSLPNMLREKPFAHWREHWGPRPVRAVRAAFRTATAKLIELGPKAPRRAKAAVFRRLVEELNELDDREGCIETGEREELVERIEELGALVGLSNTDEQLTGKRDW